MPSAGLPSESESELFELVVLDENGLEGSFPTPDNVLQCGQLGPMVPVEFVAPDFESGGTLGVYADPGGTLCSTMLQPLVPFRWYVLARLEGMTKCGLYFVEFGVHTLPAEFFVNITPNADAYMSAGNLFGSALIAFHCEAGDGQTVLLYTVDGIATAAPTDLVLQVESSAAPTNRFWPYPWAETCPEVLGARRRMLGLQFIVNPSPGRFCETTVRVEPATWTRVKQVYRN